MTAEGFIRGHEIYYDCNNMTWRYKNNHKIVKKDDDLKCPRCGEKPVDSVDFCLSGLKDCDFIEAACCGHGVEKGYILLKDGRRFEEVITDE